MIDFYNLKIVAGQNFVSVVVSYDGATEQRYISIDGLGFRIIIHCIAVSNAGAITYVYFNFHAFPTVSIIILGN